MDTRWTPRTSTCRPPRSRTETSPCRSRRSRGTRTGPPAAVGGFSLGPLLAGEYELSAGRGDAAAFPVRLRVTGNEHWQNFTLSVSGRVTGLTRIYGTPAPYATLEFQSASGGP